MHVSILTNPFNNFDKSNLNKIQQGHLLFDGVTGQGKAMIGIGSNKKLVNFYPFALVVTYDRKKRSPIIHQ